MNWADHHRDESSNWNEATNLTMKVEELIKPGILDDTATSTASMTSICDFITIVSSTIVLLRSDKNYLHAFGLCSTVREHHDYDELLHVLTKIQAQMHQAASTLHIRLEDELKKAMDNAMQYNETLPRQSFLGNIATAGVLEALEKNMGFVYAYLTSVELATSSGVIKFHLIYDLADINDNHYGFL